MKAKVYEIIQSHIQRFSDEVDKIKFDENIDLIADGILDSMEFLDLIMELEQYFGKKIVSRLLEFDNPGLVQNIVFATTN